jgi:hypothetical protein
MKLAPDYIGLGGRYRRLAARMVNVFGELVRVEYRSHFPNFEIGFVFERTTVISGYRTGKYDIHFLTLGYRGDGPACAQAFLDELGFSLSLDDIAGVEAGDVIVLDDAGAISIHRKQLVLPQRVCWVCDRPFGSGESRTNEIIRLSPLPVADVDLHRRCARRLDRPRSPRVLMAFLRHYLRYRAALKRGVIYGYPELAPSRIRS